MRAIAAGILYFLHMDGVDNPADLLTKFLPWAVARAFIEPLLLWRGETN